MPWDKNLINLKYVLADLYFLKEDSIPVVLRAGLPPAQIRFQDKAVNNWSEILDQADKRGKVTAIIDEALRDFPNDPNLLSARRGTLNPAQDLVDDERFWKSSEPFEVLEAILGQESTLLPVSWLEGGLERVRAVAKVSRADGKYGSGFLTKHNIFVTNHHVLSTAEEARAATIQFNYQHDSTGLAYETVDMELDPSTFRTSIEDDWTFVRIKGDANADWGAIDLIPVEISVNRRANIIQHPGGQTKRIALYHNIITYVDDRQVQYLTDTLPGSSGSPVFDNEWRLIALHQKGGFVVDTGTKRRVHPNTGVNVHRLIRGLENVG